MTLRQYKRPALIGLAVAPLLAACMDTNMTAQDALPEDPSAYSAEIAQLRDDLQTLETAGTTIAEPTRVTAPVVVHTADGQPTSAPPDTTVAMPFMIEGLGFAQIANQPGATTNQKRLMALRAARLDALRDLTEQVHGIHINASTTVGQARVISDTLSASVDGTIRGARTVSINPKGSDGYEVKLALDADTVAYIVRAAQGAL